MKSIPPSLPGLVSLYRNDLIIGRAANTVGFGLMVAVGMWWASQPVAPVDPAAPPPPGAEEAPWIIAFGLILSAVASIVLMWRWLRVKRIFRHGAVIKGMVENLEVSSYTTDSDSNSSTKPTTRHSYYITLRYTAAGAEHKVRLKLPNSGFTFGLMKGKETDLSVLDSAPDKPLIRAVYLGRA